MSSLVRRILKARATRAALVGVMSMVCAVIAAQLVPLPARLFERHSRVIEYHDGTPAFVSLSPDEKWRVRVNLEELDASYVPALLALEDQRFFAHHGVDPLAVARAAVMNVMAGRRTSGASTITMQLVRVLEPRPRTFNSKVIESFRAAQLELRLSKREILTAYLQFVPYGKNIEGVEAASLAYFGHRPTALSAAEVATLLAVPQSPNERYPSSRHLETLRTARARVAERLINHGALATAARDDIGSTPVPERLRPVPRDAPHVAAWLAQKDATTERLRTTLERGTQRLAEQAMATAAIGLRTRGVHNGAAVVLDRTGAIRALVGNFDFTDRQHGGQIIGFDTPRSPGSALKPLLYAMAIDRGLAGPEQLVPDLPVQFGAYAPQNFDDRFDGLVRLEDALSRSLNVPFVNLLKTLGVEHFLNALRAHGITSLNTSPDFYGLSAVVGGIEVTPLELAALYVTLANDGRAVPLRWSGETPAPRPLYAPGAAFLTKRALLRKERPDTPSRLRLTGTPPDIHWKTGTSFGHRDAWAAGSGPEYTAVVWLGNFDNSPSVHLVGTEAAAPVLFELLQGLGSDHRPLRAPPTPADLTSVEVCAYSGFAPTEACPTRQTTLAVRRTVPTAPCPFHKHVDIDATSGLALTPACRVGVAHVERRTFLDWPAGVRRYLAEERRPLPPVPAWAPGCTPLGRKPVIVSPAAGQVKLLLPGVPPERQEVALEAEHTAAGELSWFVDGQFLGSVGPDQPLWWTPSVGRHEVVVSTESGQLASAVLQVKWR